MVSVSTDHVEYAYHTIFYQNACCLKTGTGITLSSFLFMMMITFYLLLSNAVHESYICAPLVGQNRMQHALLGPAHLAYSASPVPRLTQRASTARLLNLKGYGDALLLTA